MMSLHTQHIAYPVQISHLMCKCELLYALLCPHSDGFCLQLFDKQSLGFMSQVLADETGSCDAGQCGVADNR